MSLREGTALMIDDALKGLTRRQLEDLQTKIALELQSCAICEAEGADHYLISGSKKSVGKAHIRGSILLCKPCFERVRLPESRAMSPSGGVEERLGEGTLAE